MQLIELNPKQPNPLNNIKPMIKRKLMGRIALAGCLLLAAAGISRAGSNCTIIESSSAPVPGT